MHKENFNAKAVVEAGLISTLIVIIMMMTIYVPLFSMLGIFILPIPVTVLYLRHNAKVTIAAVVVSAILISMLYSPISALASSILFGFTGVTLGYCIKNNKKVWFTLVMLAVVSVLATVIDFSVYVTFIDKGGLMGFINQNIRMMKDSMTAANEIYSKMGVPQAQLEQFNKSFELFTPEFVIQLIPTVLLLMAFTSAYINYYVTRSILKKLRYEIEPLPPFSSIYINNRIGTLILLFVIAGMILDRSNMSSGNYILVSSELILQMVLLTEGASLVAHYLRNKFKLNKTFTLLIIFITVTSSYLALAYVCAGLMDMIFDFRKLDHFRRKKAQ
jgi:uncharacterized protein YybS (DUF2232 family)